jgi:hypothetical protein
MESLVKRRVRSWWRQYQLLWITSTSTPSGSFGFELPNAQLNSCASMSASNRHVREDMNKQRKRERAPCRGR